MSMNLPPQYNMGTGHLPQPHVKYLSPGVVPFGSRDVALMLHEAGIASQTIDMTTVVIGGSERPRKRYEVALDKLRGMVRTHMDEEGPIVYVDGQNPEQMRCNLLKQFGVELEA